MTKAKFTPASLFDQALDRACSLFRVVPSLNFHKPKGALAYAADLAHHVPTSQPQIYGKRFFYRDTEGQWNAIDALLSGNRLTGIALHEPKAASRWVVTLRNARKRKDSETDFTRPAFVMTPGHNLHFLSFPKRGGKKPVKHLHLHDGFRPKPRTKLVGHIELKGFHDLLDQRAQEASAAHTGANSE